jgi:hypothetical protein
MTKVVDRKPGEHEDFISEERAEFSCACVVP